MLSFGVVLILCDKLFQTLIMVAPFLPHWLHKLPTLISQSPCVLPEWCDDNTKISLTNGSSQNHPQLIRDSHYIVTANLSISHFHHAKFQILLIQCQVFQIECNNDLFFSSFFGRSSQDSQSVTHSRGQKSQKSNEGNSISEDISEDIQEEIDISGDDDFLASSQEKVSAQNEPYPFCF